MFIIIILIYAILASYEMIPLYKQKLSKDFWVNTVLTSTSLLIAILMSLNVKIPSPAKPIEKIISFFIGK